MFHPLERTAATIANVTLDTATARISDFMKNHSITCDYSEEGYANCMTDSLLKFVVQLWQGNNNTMIMEVQRRQGCCIELQKLRNQLIAVVRNGESSASQQKPSRTTCEFLETLLDQTTAAAPPPSRECLPTALEICRTMLESEQLDANRLGLESLLHLTDPSKVLSKDADQASRTFLSDSSYQDLLEKYFVGMEKEDADDDVPMEYEEGQFFGSLHLLALKVLSQSLESALASNQSSCPISIDLSSLFWRTVLQALYSNLQEASRRPLEASVSIRCLRLLQTLEPSTLKLVPSQSRLHEFLSSARQYGRDHSCSLEQETGQLMGRLEFVH
jgi:hypothetical protein